MQWAIDHVLPQWDQHERHSQWIDAVPERVWQALDELCIRDLPLSVLLARLRGGPAAWRGGLGDAGDRRALDSVAPRELSATPPRELLLGDIACYTAMSPARPDITRGDMAAFCAFDEPGWTKVAMNFALTPERGGTRLATETRVRATDEAARRAFRWYWLLVRTGSAVIRRDILRGVKARATEVAS